MKLDRYDLKILDTLQDQASISNLELAERIGLSPTPCARRVRALEDAGIIKQRVTLLDSEALGLGLTAVVQVAMDKHIPARFSVFEKAVNSWPEVLECYLITGQAADYMLKVAVRDMKDYERFLLGKLTQIAGVTGVQSSFVLRKVVHTTRLPLPLG